MPRSLTLGNGNLLVTLDEEARVRDLFFPYVGYENHIGQGLSHRVGVFVDGALSWLDGGGWHIEVRGQKDSLTGVSLAKHEGLGLSLSFTDSVYNEKNIFLRRVVIKNERPVIRDIKVFFYQQFEPYASRTAHTAYYDPKSKAIIHYRNKRTFLINGLLEGEGFGDYATGVFGQDGKEGTFRDAEDGHLTKNPVEHGQADSIIGFSRRLREGEEKIIHYWISVGRSRSEVLGLNTYVLDRSPEHLTRTTRDFWHAWVNRRNFNFYDLKEESITLFERSLLVIRAHTGQNGSIIASSDSAMLQNGKDTYSYVWPRDASIAAIALDRAGDTNVARRFFEFARNAISPEGYFMHKYSPDGSLGSSWHPWIRNNTLTLPIQEDETALLIWALWKHYETNKDIEFIEEVYNTLIRPAADFLVSHVDTETNLPLGSFDLWEERFGTAGFTAAAVFGALVSATSFAETLGRLKSRRKYAEAAEKLKSAIEKYLWNEKDGHFRRMVNVSIADPLYDETIDISSAYGMFRFGVFNPDDPRLFRAMLIVKKHLSLDPHQASGTARYEGDQYYTEGSSIGNPWIITTLWMAQYYIAIAKEEKDLEIALQYLSWVEKQATLSGMLPEQIGALSNKPLSATPLVWSHAEFVATVLEYMSKKASFSSDKKAV